LPHCECQQRDHQHDHPKLADQGAFKRGGDDKGVHTLLKDAISLKRLDGSSPSAQTKWNQITLSHILRHAST
jgi:hypothetical protein